MSETFGEYIKLKRKQSGLSLRKMAGKMGISPSYLSDIEKNKRYAPVKEKLNTFVKLLKISPQEITYFYDLAGESRNETPQDITQIIKKNGDIKNLLRKVKETNLDVTSLIHLIEEEWFVNLLNDKEDFNSEDYSKIIEKYIDAN